MKTYLKKTFPKALHRYRCWKTERARAKIEPYRSEWGFKLNGDLSYTLGFGRADRNRIENGEAVVYEALFSVADVFIDIGANIGLYTLLAGKKGMPCVAVEPSRHNFDYLLQNLSANQQRQTEAYNLALGSEPGFAMLFGEGEMASLNDRWNPASATSQNLTAINTLDAICGYRFNGQQLMIKVDVEGHELEVMKGAQLLIEKTPPPIWIIEHRANQKETSAGADSLFRSMLEAGYVIVPLPFEERVITSASEKIPDASDDFIFIPSGSDLVQKVVTQLKNESE